MAAKTLHIRIADTIGVSEDLFGWYGGFTALELEFRLQEIPNPEKIVLHISTAGGDVEEGLAIYNKLVELREAGTEIGVIVESHCYSIGTLIAMAASPNQLQIRESALWCVHKPMYPAVFYANADQFRTLANNLDACEAAISAAYVRRTGKPIEEIQAKLREDVIVSAAAAIADGWLDATVENTPETVHNTEKAIALKPMAFVRSKNPENQINPKNMANNVPKPETGINAVMAKLKGIANDLLKISDPNNAGGTGGSPKAEGEEIPPVNGTAKLADDAGTVIYFEGDLAIDKTVFTDELMTVPVSDGDHGLEDGRTITVLNGVVTAIVEAEDEKDALLNAKDQEINDLKAKVAELEKGNPEDIKKMEGMVATLTEEVEKLKKFVPDSGDTSKRSAQTNFPKTETPKVKSALDANAANLKR
jgi:ATP-dependent protease ClpP protease subunit